MILTSALVVLPEGRKPNWSSVISPLMEGQRYLRTMILSVILERIEVTEIGRRSMYPLYSDRVFTFRTGVTRACFQVLGTFPWDKDELIKLAIMADSSHTLHAIYQRMHYTHQIDQRQLYSNYSVHVFFSRILIILCSLTYYMSSMNVRALDMPMNANAHTQHTCHYVQCM